MRMQNLYDHMPWFIQNIILSVYGLFIFSNRYCGLFSTYVKRFSDNISLNVNEVIEYQEKALVNILKYSYTNVEYYNEYCKNENIGIGDICKVSDLKKFPIITKEIVKRNPDKFVSKEKRKEKLVEYPTGGSSGSPLIVYTTKNEIQYNFALYETRVKREFGVKTGDKVATFLGKRICTNAKSPPYWRKNIVYNQTLYSIYHMNENTMKYYIDELKKQKPDLIIGYVSPIFLLAKYMLANNEYLPIKAIFTSSEALLDKQREVIEKAFKTKVCNSYSQAESVAFITQCKNGKLHLVPEYGYCEFENVYGTDYYEIIGTTLFNYTMPLIRYRTGDYVKIDKDPICSCGWNSYPIIKEIFGRSSSLIRLKSGNIISEAPLSLVFKNYVEIKEVQIVQKDLSNIDVLYIVEKNVVSNTVLNSIVNELNKVFNNEVNVNMYEVEKIEKNSNGKNQFIKSLLL